MKKPMTYDQLIKDLPIPSWDQCERFARHVSQAHSWYKTPIDENPKFVLFLDPCPTFGRCHPSADNPITVGNINLFGHWNYVEVPPNDNAARLYRWEAPHARSSDGTKTYLPDVWRNTGCVHFDAFAFPWVIPPTPVQFLTSEEKFNDEFITLEEQCSRARSILEERMARRGQRLKTVLETMIPSRFRESLKPSGIMDPESPLRFTHALGDWPDENWIKQLLDSQVPPALWSPLCKYFELITHEARLDSILASAEEHQLGSGNASPRELDRAFFPMALAEERVIQLTGLTDSMTRFLDRVAQTREPVCQTNIFNEGER